MWYAHGQGGIVAFGCAGELLQQAIGQVLAHHGNGGFRQDDDVGAGFGDHVVIGLDGVLKRLRIPFHALFNIALQQGHGGAAAIGLGPALLA